jgi:SAM-dependent methyltransferase
MAADELPAWVAQAAADARLARPPDRVLSCVSAAERTAAADQLGGPGMAVVVPIRFAGSDHAARDRIVRVLQDHGIDVRRGAVDGPGELYLLRANSARAGRSRTCSSATCRTGARRPSSTGRTEADATTRRTMRRAPVRGPAALGGPAGHDGAVVDHARFYAEAYTHADAEQANAYGEWRSLGARTKAEHVVALCDRVGVRPERLVEIGCGSGSLLAELAARGAAPRLDGYDLSAPAIEIARGHALPGVRVEVFDGAHIPAADDAYDLAVLSHVLEHVPVPAALLAEAARLAPWVLIEVPLERNRSAARPTKRAEAARIGHIQFFDRAAVHSLCAGSGLEIRADLADPLGFEQHAFFAHGSRARGKAALKAAVRRAAWRVAPRVAERWFTVHYACLAARRA